MDTGPEPKRMLLAIGQASLIVAGLFSAVGSALHLACIPGGPAWYRFLGAGRRVVHFAEMGSALPAIYAVTIAAIVAGWSIYALSGAGVIRRLPFLRTILILISLVSITRAAALPLLLEHMQDSGRSRCFLVTSSAIMLSMGMMYAVGIGLLWGELKISHRVN